jgi:chromosome segregation ATPase
MSNEIDQVQGVLTEFSRVEAGLAALREKHGNTVYDVSTTIGLDAAKAARSEIREPRYAVENVRKAAKAPLVALGKRIDIEAARITSEILKIETPVDEQIKAEEARRVADREAKKAAEVERVRLEAAAKLKEEEDRLAADRAALKADQDRLAADRAKVEAQRAALQAEAAEAKKKADAEAAARRAAIEAEAAAAKKKADAEAAARRAAIEVEAAEAKRRADAEREALRIEQEKAAAVEAARIKAEEDERKAAAEAKAREFAASLPPFGDVVGLIEEAFGVDRDTAISWILHYAEAYVPAEEPVQ